MKLIDADALMGFPIRLDKYDKEHGNEHFVLGIESVLEYAEHLPTVDAVPVVHGRWINTGDSYEDERCRYNYWECSACGNRIAGRYGLHRYCPNCGAKMVLEMEHG